MAVAAAQRNAKITGISRLYKRDGKPRYLGYPLAGVAIPQSRLDPSRSATAQHLVCAPHSDGGAGRAARAKRDDTAPTGAMIMR
jgi:hypothetical protein